MTKNYQISAEASYDSEYESDGGTKYHPKEYIGEGSYCKARKLISTDGKKTKVVLSPIQIDEINNPKLIAQHKAILIAELQEELEKKSNFYKAIYPQEEIHHSKAENEDYRLVVPLINGELYKKITISSTEEFIKIYLSAIEALQEAHAKKIIITDLKSDNITYDMKTGKSFLLDGGLSHQVGDSIIFESKDLREMEIKRRIYKHIAPECWYSTANHDVKANVSIDVYSLGFMMDSIRKNNAITISDILKRLIDQCLCSKTEYRPTLDLLGEILEMILLRDHSKGENTPASKNNNNAANFRKTPPLPAPLLPHHPSSELLSSAHIGAASSSEIQVDKQELTVFSRAKLGINSPRITAVATPLCEITDKRNRKSKADTPFMGKHTLIAEASTTSGQKSSIIGKFFCRLKLKCSNVILDNPDQDVISKKINI